jgi:PAS domain S-box-containing protein
MGIATAATLNSDGSPVPLRLDSSSSHGHAVQFYKDDSFLLEQLVQFLGPPLSAGNSVLLIATEAHRDSLLAHLRSCGTDFAPALAGGRFLLLDADETLAEFMVNGQPDPARFEHALSDRMARLVSAAAGTNPQVFAFGEMVASLWEDGNRQAALRLEQIWNGLAEKYKLQLLCAYPMRLFSQAQDRESLLEICSEHSHVIPAECPTPVGDEERLHSFPLLEQKAKALESEASERRKIQDALQEREAELSDFLENAVIGMHWLAPDGTIVWANKSDLARSGYARDEYIGHHVSKFYVDRHAAEDILQRLSRHEELHGYGARLKSKDGSIHHVRIDSNVFVREGRFVHTRCFITDVTEKEEAEHALFQLAAIVESSHDAIISKDLNGIITSWNRSAERVLGYKAEEMIGKSITLLIPPELQHDEVVILAKIRAGERTDHFETTRLRKNGEAIDVSLTVSPVRDRQGTIIGAAKILRDITQQKQMEKSLRISERLASVGRLAATIAHEINNPLEAITNFIYLAKQQPELCEDTRRYLSTADQELGRVAHIVQQTLGFYRNNSHPSSRLIADVMEDVLTIYQRKCMYKNLRIDKSVEPGLTVNTVQGELKQILSNLITNAIDASPQGGRIAIRARSVGGLRSGRRGIRITIADNGAGIPPRDRGKMFAPFFTTKKEVGTGLGLWISKDLLEKRGGDIRVRSSNSGQTGTVMSVYLPSEFQPAGPSAL